MFTLDTTRTMHRNNVYQGLGCYDIYINIGRGEDHNVIQQTQDKFAVFSTVQSL